MNARYVRFHSTVKLGFAWIFEFGKCFSYWLMAFLIAAPAFAAQPPSTAMTVYQPPGLPATTANASAASVQKSLIDLRNEIRPIEKRLSELGDKIESQKASADEQAEYTHLRGQTQPLLARQNELLKQAGLTHAALPAQFLQDPMAADDQLKVVNATIETADTQLTREEKLTPDELNHEMHANGNFVGRFSSEYLNYSVSMGIMAMTQLVYADPSNPNFYENWEKQTFSLLGAAGFAVFMGSNHGVIKLYKLMKKNRPPGPFINYVGMSVGMVAQSVFTELYNDKNTWKCIRPYYDAKAKPVADACKTLRNDWMVNKKILQYTPQVISMLTSSKIAEYAQRGFQKAGGHRISSGYLRMVERGFKIMPKAEYLKGAEHVAAVTLPKFVGGIGNFVLFLAIDSYWTEGVVNQGWENFRDNEFDLKAWSDKWGMHSEYFWPKTFQPIQNAFDVEATTPSTAHAYMMELLRKMQASGWKKPAAPESCIPKNIADAAKNAKPDEGKDRWFWQNWGVEWSRAKSNEQLSCEVFARPADLIARYGEVNRDWRTTLLSPFNTSENNWVEMITEFMTVYTATHELAQYMATQKDAVATKNAAAPDLSREALAKVINTPLISSDTNADRPEQAQSWFLDGTWIPTPELVDYIVAGTACGADPVLDPNANQPVGIGRFFGSVYTFGARKILSPSFVSTPYGSSLRFVPPRLTNKSRAICENVPTSFYGTVNYITGNHLPDLTGKQDVKNPFSGVFTDENGKTYGSLAEYSFANLNPNMYKPVGSSTSFVGWWASHFDKVIIPIWARYDKTYRMFIDKYYIPVLFDRTYRDGLLSSCKANSEDTARDGLMSLATKPAGKSSSNECTNPASNAYRVSNGVFLSYETELRNYLRGMYSLYMSTFTAKDPAQADAKTNYMNIANSLIMSIRIVDAEALRSDDFDQLTQNSEQILKSLNDLIAARVTTQSSDDQFRTEVLAKFNDQISKIITEEQQVKKNVHLLQFGGSAGGAMGALLNGPIGASLGGTD